MRAADDREKKMLQILEDRTSQGGGKGKLNGFDMELFHKELTKLSWERLFSGYEASLDLNF